MRHLLEGLSGRGWDQQVLNPFAAPRRKDEILPPGVDIHYSARTADRLTKVPSLRSWIKKELEAFRPSIVHAHLFHAAVLVAAIDRKSEAARVLTHHHGRVFDIERRTSKSLVDRWAARRFDRIVAVSQEVRSFLLERYRCPPGKVDVIPNGWDPRFWQRPRSQSGNEIVCVANLRREKSIDLLVKAFAVVRHRVPAAHLTLVGDGPMRNDLEALARDLKVRDQVRFTGFVTDVAPLLSEASVFCLPSSYETLGISILEAMAAGVPVVATRVGGVPEVVEDGSTGYLVDPGDVAMLAERLTMLLESPEMRNQMAVAAQRAVKSYSLEKMVTAYSDLYGSLLRNSSD